MKKLYFGSNLKMYKGISATREYLQKLVENTKDISRDDIELFIIPSYTTLQTATDCCDRDFVRLGAQNMCWEDQGQFTGEISPCMLAEMGLDLVMIGHSERRHVFGESDVEENKKVKAALSHGFKTLLCIGETAEQKEYGISAETLRSQLKIGFYGVSPEECKNIWVAYEPVWSIGVNGTPASADYAEAMHKEYCIIVAAWKTVRDTVRRCKEAGVDPHKHLLLAHDVILSAAVEKYEDSHDNKLPVIGKKDTDFVFDEYKTAIIDKDARKAAKKAETKYFSQN